MENKSIQMIADLIKGSRLSSIQFVLDYLMLGFDEKGALTSLVWPTVLIENSTIKHGDDGYHDKICKQIGKTVREVHLLKPLGISIDLEDGTEIGIDLSTFERDGERAIFSGSKNLLIVI